MWSKIQKVLRMKKIKIFLNKHKSKRQRRKQQKKYNNKIEYNEFTKELRLIEKEHKIIIQIKNWLEKYRVFFEAGVMVFLSTMSIIISAVGVNINNKTKEIYEKQLEILENDREPHFTIDCETIFEKFDTDSYYIQNRYIIKNEGGLINDAFIKNINAYVIIDIPVNIKNDNDLHTYKNIRFRYKEDKFSMPNRECFYNTETKEFVFYGVVSSDTEDFKIALEQELNRILGRDDIYII